jgi:hypothetical protein
MDRATLRKYEFVNGGYHAAYQCDGCNVQLTEWIKHAELPAPINSLPDWIRDTPIASPQQRLAL